ncbi:MAG: hypothetical protein M9949_01775 [Candidatus Kapabacteria bacterium]|nr:hypothetical protein [Candidatus Kapabacteria bacterium]
MSVPKIQAVDPETGEPLFLDPVADAPLGTNGQTLRFNSGDELEATSAITVTISGTHKETIVDTDMDDTGKHLNAVVQLNTQLGADLETSLSQVSIRADAQRPSEGIESCGIEIKSRNLAEPQSESEILLHGDKFNINNMQLHNALLEKVTSLPTGLTEAHAGRVVRMGSGFYFWQGWRWVGLSDNKYHFKPNDQIVPNDGIWHDDNNIVFDVGALELYSFEFYMFPQAGPLANGMEYTFKFTPSEAITEMYGTNTRNFYMPYSGSENKLKYNVNLLNEVVFAGLDDEDPPIPKIYFGILYGGSVTSTIKLQHKVTSLVGNAEVKATTRIILKRIY